MTHLSKSSLEQIINLLENVIYNHNNQIEIWTSHWDQIPVLSVYLSHDENRIIIDAGYDTKEDFKNDREEKKRKISDIIHSSRNEKSLTADEIADKILDLFEHTKKGE
jgi:hypothetical protein